MEIRASSKHQQKYVYIHVYIRCHVKFLCVLLCCSELPHSPRSLTAQLNDSDSRSVLLSWLRPFDGNSPLLHYVLELSENSMYCLFLHVRTYFVVLQW